MEEKISIQVYIKILLKRKWTIFVVVTTALLAVFILNSVMLPVYKATTTILISPSETQLSLFGGIRANPIFGGADEIKTHIEILKSYNIIQGVAEQLPAGIFAKAKAENMREKEDSLAWPLNIFFRLFSNMKNADTSINEDKNNNIESEAHFRETIKQIRETISVNLVKDTNMIEISYENSDPELAAEIANTTAAVFVEQSLVINRSSASEVKKFIEEQLSEKEKELAEEEEKLQYATSLEDLPDKELQLARLERTIRVSENTYLTLLEKYQEARINEVMEFRDIRIIDQALVPDESIKPRTMVNLAIGGILGLMLGVILAFFLEYMDNTIKNSKDVERVLNLPVLGVIPKDTSRKNERKEKSGSVN